MIKTIHEIKTSIVSPSELPENFQYMLFFSFIHHSAVIIATRLLYLIQRHYVNNF